MYVIKTKTIAIVEQFHIVNKDLYIIQLYTPRFKSLKTKI